MSILRIVATVTRELRDAALRLRKRPVTSAVIVAMLALAIGANGANGGAEDLEVPAEKASLRDEG